MNLNLIKLSKNEYNAVPFDKFSASDFIPSINESIRIALEKIEKIKNSNSTDFDSVILALEASNDELEYTSTIYYNLHSAECPDELNKISSEISDLITNFSNDVLLDQELFIKVKACFDSRHEQKLDAEQLEVLQSYYDEFVRNGALLDESGKSRLREIDTELAKLSLAFSQNALKAMNAYELHITDVNELKGLTDIALEQAQEKAQSKNKDGYLFGLDYPTMASIMGYCENRDIRRQYYMASASKCLKGEFDNCENIKKIITLRYERANLLGHKTHADFVLEKRMAQTPQKVMSFLEEIKDKAMPFAKKDVEQVKDIAQRDGISDLMPWDFSFYMEKLKKETLDFDDEVLRPYFKLENVINGVFEVASKLYNLKFEESATMPKYHTDVKTYKVFDSLTNDFIGLFYADFFPRETKRSGAWMTQWWPQGHLFGKTMRPAVAIVCNFTKPTKSKPSLLTFNEVTTLFHEFGHSLHGLLSNVKYKKLSGPNVYWDFVELPSQILENWCSEKECLDIFARHYETGEAIPADLVEKIKKSATFMEGYYTIRQVTFGLLDMAYHWNEQPEKVKDIESFEKEILKEVQLLPKIENTASSPSFSHIFAGGYSAGYYSYKWAEVLDADAFAYFKENGIFDPEVAKRFKDNVLSRGGVEHPMELYKKFRGQEPTVDALFKRAGFH